VAFNGKEGLEVASKFSPKLILLDLLMPVKDGLGFLKDFQQQTLHPDVRIVIFSNLDMQKEAEEAFTLGAAKYVLKAWATPKTLTSIVEVELKK
jgi:CheY-like chemotaxis protein